MLDALKTSQRLTVAAGAVFTAVTAALVVAGAPNVARFVVSGLALAALATLVGQSIEQIGERLGPGPTGLLQSCLGNLPELFVGIFALRAGLTTVVEAALVGSVLGNILLVLGAALVAGGARHGPQHFAPQAPRMLVTLLALAIGATLVPTLAVRLGAGAARHSVALSDTTAFVLLVVYLASIPFWLSGGPQGRPQPADATAAEVAGTPGGRPSTEKDGAPGMGHPAQPGLWPFKLALVLLVCAGVLSAFVSDWFVDALVPATHSLGLNPQFTGLVVVAIASNAVENVAGVRFAWKARPDYALSTILNSPLQIALFLTPVLVISSHIIGGPQLTMVFPLLLVAALAVAVMVVAIVLLDGEYSWLEGVALIALYVVIASSLWWGL